MYIWEGLSVRALRTEQWRSVTDQVITIEQAYVVTTIQATRESRWIPRFAKVNVNKCDIFYWIVFIQLACSSFRCTLSLYWQCINVHSVTAAQSELNAARIWYTQKSSPANTHPNNRAPSRDLLKFIDRLRSYINAFTICTKCWFSFKLCQCNYIILAELPGFARNSRSIIIHVLVAVFPQFNMWPLTPPSTMPHGLSRG